jgi:hypothetical protein
LAAMYGASLDPGSKTGIAVTAIRSPDVPM